MGLEEFWFVLIAVLWSGYFLLEGFDFGVGMLLPFLPRDERERSLMFESIGPVWDGNEVWLVVAAGATFAAFPAWYAAMFSGFYVALLGILVLLILRVISFEWRSRSQSPRWRETWRWANTAASVGAPFLWGAALASLLYGVPLDAKGNFTGDVASFLTPYSVLGGVAVVVVFAFHGATYLSLRTTGALLGRTQRAAAVLSAPAAVAAIAFLAATVAVAVERNERGALGPAIPAVLGALAVLGAGVAAHLRRGLVAFALTAGTAIALMATLFCALYPRVMVSDPSFANSLTVAGAASASYTLKVITVVGVLLVPVVLLYQGWSYYVFRARVSGATTAVTPVDAVGQRAAAPAE